MDRNFIIDRLKNSAPGRDRRSNEDAQIRSLSEEERNPWIRGDKPLIPAAVLVPLVAHDEGFTVLLTRRTETLSSHAGQISFPGGRVDDDDESALHTALREAEEEVGLPPDDVEVIGRLDDYIVGTGYLVNPIIGIIEPPLDLTAHEHEVAEIFEAPLSYLIDPANIERHSRELQGHQRHYFAITWNDYYIWGATAGMLRNLSERIWRDE